MSLLESSNPFEIAFCVAPVYTGLYITELHTFIAIFLLADMDGKMYLEWALLQRLSC